MSWRDNWLDDGFGTRWIKCGRKDCGLQIVRPGKAQCAHGEPCPDAEAWMRANCPDEPACTAALDSEGEKK